MAIDGDVVGTGTLLKGVATIPTAKGLDALEHLLIAGDTQASVLPIDWQEFTAPTPNLPPIPFWRRSPRTTRATTYALPDRRWRLAQCHA